MTSHCHERGCQNTQHCSQRLLDDTDLVAGDFSGASWRRNVGAGQQYGSTLQVATENTRLPVPPRHPHCGGALEACRMTYAELTNPAIFQQVASRQAWFVRDQP